MCMKQGIEFYTEEGRFSIAAKHQKELAELYEDQSDLENAIAAFQTAADYYEGEGQSSASNQCLLKVFIFIIIWIIYFTFITICNIQLFNNSKLYSIYRK